MFKGSGFYVNDHPKGGGNNGRSKADSENSSESKDDKAAKSESKDTAKSDAKKEPASSK
jgi:predicted nucleic acid-binding Zn ribbon protein